MSTRSDNAKILRQLSLYLNLMSDAIDKEMVDELAADLGKEAREYAYATLLATYCGYDLVDSGDDKRIFRERFCRGVEMQDMAYFMADPYYKNIKFPSVSSENWEFKTMCFKPYEAFLARQSILLKNGVLLPQIGFFEEEFHYPAVLQDGREWMTVTPHEIRTIRPAVNKSEGDVLTYGLGLGYFAYMAHLKENVKSVTVVEKDGRVIDIFKSHILPQFDRPEKITVVLADAFEYAENVAPAKKFDLIFADTWHDPSDGVEMYQKFKALEKYSPGSRFMYWIEETLLYYMSLDKNSDEDTSPIFSPNSGSFNIKFIEN